MGLSWCKFDVFTTSLSGKWIEMQIMLVNAVGTSGSSLNVSYKETSAYDDPIYTLEKKYGS